MFSSVWTESDSGLDYISETALSEKQSSEPGSPQGQNLKVASLEFSFISVPKVIYPVCMPIFYLCKLLHSIYHLNPYVTLWGTYYYPHFANREIETKWGYVTCQAEYVLFLTLRFLKQIPIKSFC